jgi:hypothetical protein
LIFRKHRSFLVTTPSAAISVYRVSKSLSHFLNLENRLDHLLPVLGAVIAGIGDKDARHTAHGRKCLAGLAVMQVLPVSTEENDLHYPERRKACFDKLSNSFDKLSNSFDKLSNQGERRASTSSATKGK